ncbi:lipid II flippase MurJ [Rhodococcus jostii]|uniref:lipid II flippase MurJ n=1 Tax=Rhodococcus jostii TaxID=132919 RepID=UPI003644B9A5
MSGRADTGSRRPNGVPRWSTVSRSGRKSPRLPPPESERPDPDLLFQVPFGILAVSLLTVLTPRISRAMAGGNISAVIADLGRGTRYLTAALVPITGALILLGPSRVEVMFTGRVTADQTQLIGTALTAGAFGLLPLAVVMLQLRIFYAAHDTRTPTLINLGMVTTKTLLVIAAAAALDDRHVIITLAVAGSASYTVGAIFGHLLLRRRYGHLGTTHTARTGTRILTATTLGAGAAALAITAVTAAIENPPLAAIIELTTGTLTGTVVLLTTAHLLGITEIRHVQRFLAHRRTG